MLCLFCFSVNVDVDVCYIMLRGVVFPICILSGIQYVFYELWHPSDLLSRDHSREPERLVDQGALPLRRLCPRRRGRAADAIDRQPRALEHTFDSALVRGMRGGRERAKREVEQVRHAKNTHKNKNT